MADAVQNNKLADDLEAINKAEGITLSGITLKVKRKQYWNSLRKNIPALCLVECQNVPLIWSIPMKNNTEQYF
jgi:hypothetical protein